MQDTQLGLLAPEMILAGLGLLLIIVDASSRNKRVLPGLGFVGTLLALLAVIPMFGGTSEIFNKMLIIDPFAGFFKVVFLAVTALLFLFSGEYLRKKEVRVGEFYTLAVFATLGGFLMVSSLDLLVIWIALEIMSLAQYALAGMLPGDARSPESALKYFLIGALKSAIILFGMSLVFGVTGTTYLPDVAATLSGQTIGLIGGAAGVAVLAAGMVLMLIGFAVKVAAFPFHMWVPDAYDGAPTPILASLTAVSEAAGFAAILRIFMIGLPALQDRWGLVFAIIAVASMTYGNITAIAQNRVKRMMAYSAVAQAGYILVGIAVGTPEAVGAMLYYLLAYAFMTVGAFAVFTLISNQGANEEISDFRGLIHRAPAAALMLALYMLSLIGIPPTAGFFGKFSLYKAAMGAGYAWLALAIVLNSVISVPYYYGVVRTMFLKEEDGVPAPIRVGSGIGLALGVTAIATIVLGLFPEPVLRWINLVHVLPQ